MGELVGCPARFFHRLVLPVLGEKGSQGIFQATC